MPNNLKWYSISTLLLQLSTSDRIATIEAELYNLRARNLKFILLVRTRAQKARDPTVERTDEEDEAAVKAARQPQIVEVPDKEARLADEEPTVTAQPDSIPEHPYSNAKDAAYTPPTDRNIGAPVKIPANVKKIDPAYKTLPAVEMLALGLSSRIRLDCEVLKSTI